MAAIGESLRHSRPQSSNASLTILLKAFWSVIFKPEKARRLGGVLNGQLGRQELLTRLARTFEPQLVVETGAHRGVTTQFLARTFRVPTLACEIDPVFFWEAKWRTLAQRNCRIFPEDTREFLRRIGLRMKSPEDRVLIYLDAHWDPQDLPLLEELKIIHHQIRHAIILIDDFRHPEDPGYGFDEYAGGVNIELKLLKRADPAFHQVFFPILDSSRETGMKRGSAYLGLGSGLKLLETCKELKKISAVRGL
jgi:predicted O-methyltransferase YrrM